MSVIHFGTDGWRGRIAREFTFERVREASQAIAEYLSKHSSSRGSLVVGHDRRFLSEQFARASAEVFAGNGFKVYLFPKPVPTPLISFAVVQKKLLGGIVLTASHNPPEFHGLKFKEPSGSSASPRTTAAIERSLGHSRILKVPFQEALQRKRIVWLQMDRVYIASLRRRVDQARLKNSRLKVLADGLYGSAAEYLPLVLSLGSVRVDALHTHRDVLFGGLSPEPIPPNLGELIQGMRRGLYDVGFALDGDGDRFAAILPGGHFLPPTKILALLLLHFVENKGLRGKVVKTVSSSSLIDRIASAFDLEVLETPVGFKHISEKMVADPDFLIGGEESGGMGFRGSLPERDGLLSALLFLEMMAFRRKSITRLLKELDQRFGSSETDRIDLHYPKERWELLVRRVRKEGEKLLLGDSLLDLKGFDGLKLIGKKSWLLFRMSGTEPLLRIYAEGPSLPHVQRLLKQGRSLALKESRT
ncbi:MAG: phosphoglucomutase/phosphomannomutase family protein [Candidatus Omnitrophica bacterium]|nr:phosphoglucomutase/phosphomannomutase family protein [Candidatus Omnitrophota bacterium]